MLKIPLFKLNNDTESFAGPVPGVDDLFEAQWPLRRVKADKAWELGATGSHNTVVAVIDTGVAENHPDLAPMVTYIIYSVIYRVY